MNRGTHALRASSLALVLALALGTAWAQDQDAYVDRYGLALENLRQAVDALPDDGARAREQLDGAFSALMTLSRDVASGPLATALERVFERARTAITNSSQDDLAVQAAVLEGGFQRLLYDAAMRAAAENEVALARSRLTRLATDLGVSEADRVALADPERPAASLRFDLEAGVAEVISTRVAVARELAPTNSAGAYRALARAYGAFLLVQDSPRAAVGLNQAFVDAANALVADETEALDATLAAILVDLGTLDDAARQRLASVPAGATAAVVSEATVLPPVTTPEPTEAEAPAEPEAVAPEPPEAVTEPDGDEVVAQVEEAQPAEPEGEVDDEAVIDVAALLEEFEAAARRERLDQLEADLAAAGVPAAQRPVRAEILLEAGFERLTQVVDAFSSHVTAVTAAAHLGQASAAGRALAEASRTYDMHLSPVVRAVNTRVDFGTTELLQHLTTVDGLRVQDAVVLSGQVDQVRGALAGLPSSVIQDGARATTLVWAGTVRTVALLVVGVLALVPLFLLNLAFGGGNRNWQFIGVALFLLLVPALFEGLVALGALLVTYAGVEVLAPLAAFSMFGSTVAQTVWASMTLLAVLFAIIGLYGIGAQFGLVGRRARAQASTSATRASRATRTRATETVEWDDEV
jgi:hypothetical protein